MTIAMIAAQASNRVIGCGEIIPWRVKGEQEIFKSITMGGTLIMGRKTYESIGRPLPGRQTIVVTRNQNLIFEGCMVSHSLEAALLSARAIEAPIFVAGGGELYHQVIARADEIHLTTIALQAEGNVFFPEVPPEFELAEEKHFSTNFEYTYQLLRRT